MRCLPFATILRFAFAALTFSANAQVAASRETQAAAELERREFCSKAVPSLRETLRVAPVQRAEQAAMAGDYRYLEHWGFGSTIPGVKDQECVRKAKVFKYFYGTTDHLCSDQHAKLYNKTYEYAELYNRSITKERALRGLQSCNDA